jgi:hypothetical protein
VALHYSHKIILLPHIGMPPLNVRGSAGRCNTALYCAARQDTGRHCGAVIRGFVAPLLLYYDVQVPVPGPCLSVTLR